MDLLLYRWGLLISHWSQQILCLRRQHDTCFLQVHFSSLQIMRVTSHQRNTFIHVQLSGGTELTGMTDRSLSNSPNTLLTWITTQEAHPLSPLCHSHPQKSFFFFLQSNFYCSYNLKKGLHSFKSLVVLWTSLFPLRRSASSLGNTCTERVRRCILFASSCGLNEV